MLTQPFTMSCDIQNSISSGSGTMTASDSSEGSCSPSADVEFVWPHGRVRKEPCNSATSATEEESGSDEEEEDEEEEEEIELEDPEIEEDLTIQHEEIDNAAMEQIPLRDRLSKVCTVGKALVM